MIKYSKIYLLTGIIKDRREIRFKEIRCSGKLLRGHFNILNVQYTFDRTKEEDFDLSKHNRSEPLVALTVIRRKKGETFKCRRQYRQWRLDVSNSWKRIFWKRKKSRSLSNEKYLRSREFSISFRFNYNFQNFIFTGNTLRLNIII